MGGGGGVVFFFQAEDGIRDIGVTGVQTCALPILRADLVRLDDNWQEWEFHYLVEALRKWCERNPVNALDRKVASSTEHTNPARKPIQKREREREFTKRERSQAKLFHVYILIASTSQLIATVLKA